MSVTITKRVTKEKLSRILPRSYAKRSEGIAGSGLMTVLVFDDDPVNSGALRKALRRIEESQNAIVCAAKDFTIEALELASANNAHILSQTHFGWSDKSHEDIKIRLGSKVKKPIWNKANLP
jgi:hypothetical protein